jgi:hypothetical protein
MIGMLQSTRFHISKLAFKRILRILKYMILLSLDNVLTFSFLFSFNSGAIKGIILLISIFVFLLLSSFSHFFTKLIALGSIKVPENSFNISAHHSSIVCNHCNDRISHQNLERFVASDFERCFIQFR